MAFDLEALAGEHLNNVRGDKYTSADHAAREQRDRDVDTQRVRACIAEYGVVMSHALPFSPLNAATRCVGASGVERMLETAPVQLTDQPRYLIVTYERDRARRSLAGSVASSERLRRGDR